MNKFNKIFIILILFFTTIGTFASAESIAADISLVVPEQVSVGDTVEVLIRSQSDDELINSASVVLEFDSSLLSFSGYKTEGTVIGLMIEAPSLKAGSIHMSGIIPGGVSGLYDPKYQGLRPVPLFRVLFKAKKSGTAVFTLGQTELLRHDGKGTPLAHEKSGGSVKINAIDPTVEPNPDEQGIAPDTRGPEPFEIILIKADPFSGTPPVIVFVADDLDSGVKEYQMKRIGSRWRNVQSPVEISHSIFPYSITVRAIDFYGNSQDSTIRVPGLISVRLILVLLGVILFCAFIFRMVKYKA